jgi:hypothetical protein
MGNLCNIFFKDVKGLLCLLTKPYNCQQQQRDMCYLLQPLTKTLQIFFFLNTIQAQKNMVKEVGKFVPYL